MRGFMVGLLTLIVGERLLQPRGSTAFSGAAALPAKWLKAALDPNTPFFKAPASSSSSSSSSGKSALGDVTQGTGDLFNLLGKL